MRILTVARETFFDMVASAIRQSDPVTHGASPMDDDSEAGVGKWLHPKPWIRQGDRRIYWCSAPVLVALAQDPVRLAVLHRAASQFEEAIAKRIRRLTMN